MFLFLDIRVKGIKENILLPYTGFDLINAKIKEIAWMLVNKKGKTVERKHFTAYKDGFVKKGDYDFYKEFPNDKTLDAPYEFAFILNVLMADALNSCEVIVMNNILLKNKLIIEALGHNNYSLYQSKSRMDIGEELLKTFSKSGKKDNILLTETWDFFFSKNIPKNINLLSSLKTVSKYFVKLVWHNYINIKPKVKYHSQPIYLNQLISPNVKSIHTTKYLLADNGVKKLWFRKETSNTYTDFGNIVSFKHFNEKTSLTAWKEYRYEFGKLKQITISNSKVGQQLRYQYNYDSNGLLKTIDRYDKNGDSLGHINFHYNSINELISEFICKPDDSFIDTKYRQNGLGAICKEKCNYFFEKSYSKEYARINEYGKPNSSLRYKAIEGKPDGILIEKKFQYKKNLLVECITNKSAYDYGLNSTSKSELNYELNNRGDWILKKHKIDGKLTQTTIREIEYFN